VGNGEGIQERPSATPARSACSPASRRTRPRARVLRATSSPAASPGPARQPGRRRTSSERLDRAAPRPRSRRGSPHDRQVQRHQNIAQLRAVYGIGDDAERAPTTQRTRSPTSSGSYYQDVLGANLREADSQYATTSRQSRQNLARVGQLGSGLDAQSQSGTLSDYLRARQQAVLQASAGARPPVANLTGQRMNFEGQIARRRPREPGLRRHRRAARRRSSSRRRLADRAGRARPPVHRRRPGLPAGPDPGGAGQPGPPGVRLR
jgi:hypothetical protein